MRVFPSLFCVCVYVCCLLVSLQIELFVSCLCIVVLFDGFLIYYFEFFLIAGGGGGWGISRPFWVIFVAKYMPFGVGTRKRRQEVPERHVVSFRLLPRGARLSQASPPKSELHPPKSHSTYLK